MLSTESEAVLVTLRFLLRSLTFCLFPVEGFVICRLLEWILRDDGIRVIMCFSERERERERESCCAGFWRAIVSSEFLIMIAAYLVLSRNWDDAVIGVKDGQEGRSALGRVAELPEGLVFLSVLTGWQLNKWLVPWNPCQFCVSNDHFLWADLAIHTGRL